MNKWIFYTLCGLNGLTLSYADIHVSDWQFWAITACICGAYICGFLRR